MRIALLTDFGTRDPYVGAMRGVIASRTNAALHDLTHEIAPFDVFEAAWFLKTAAPFWRSTIFVCVVDPGVGTERRILAARDGDRTFLAPDNGLLTLVADGLDLRAVENESLFLPGGSATFHGRDRFAPVAAALAEGLPFEQLGPAAEKMEVLHYVNPSYGQRSEGIVVAIDRFGNAITDLEAVRLGPPPFDVLAGPCAITRFERTYGHAGDGPFALIGSHGCLEIAMKNANAAELLGLTRGTKVVVRRQSLVVSG